MDKKVSKMYLYLSLIFVVCLLVSNVTAAKTFALGPLTLPAAVLIFPISYIVNDLLAEVYGFKKARNTIFMGFAANIFMVLVYTLTIMLPPSATFTNQEAYATILGNTPRMFFASLAAYAVGSTLNARIMVTMRDVATKGKGLFARCILSTLVGELCDSLIFITVAFVGTMPMKVLGIMIVSQASFKTLYEIIIFPVTNLIIKKVKEIENA